MVTARRKRRARLGLGRERRMRRRAYYLRAELEGWRFVGELGQPAFNSGWSVGDIADPPAFKIDSRGVVHLRGTAHRTSGAGVRPYTLPLGYRPVHRIHRYVQEPVTFFVFILQVCENGELIVTSIDAIGEADVAFDSIRYRIDS